MNKTRAYKKKKHTLRAQRKAQKRRDEMERRRRNRPTRRREIQLPAKEAWRLFPRLPEIQWIKTPTFVRPDSRIERQKTLQPA